MKGGRRFICALLSSKSNIFYSNQKYEVSLSYDLNLDESPAQINRNYSKYFKLKNNILHPCSYTTSQNDVSKLINNYKILDKVIELRNPIIDRLHETIVYKKKKA